MKRPFTRSTTATQNHRVLAVRLALLRIVTGSLRISPVALRACPLSFCGPMRWAWHRVWTSVQLVKTRTKASQKQCHLCLSAKIEICLLREKHLKRSSSANLSAIRSLSVDIALVTVQSVSSETSVTTRALLQRNKAMSPVDKNLPQLWTSTRKVVGFKEEVPTTLSTRLFIRLLELRVTGLTPVTKCWRITYACRLMVVLP